MVTNQRSPWPVNGARSSCGAPFVDLLVVERTCAHRAIRVKSRYSGFIGASNNWTSDFVRITGHSNLVVVFFIENIPGAKHVQQNITVATAAAQLTVRLICIELSVSLAYEVLPTPNRVSKNADSSMPLKTFHVASVIFNCSTRHDTSIHRTIS